MRHPEERSDEAADSIVCAEAGLEVKASPVGRVLRVAPVPLPGQAVTTLPSLDVMSCEQNPKLRFQSIPANDPNAINQTQIFIYDQERSLGIPEC